MSLQRTCLRLQAAVRQHHHQLGGKSSILGGAYPYAKSSRIVITSGEEYQTGQKQAFGYGPVAPANAPGFDHSQRMPPETVADTTQYIIKGMTCLPKKKEIIEAIGYPGQKHAAGGITTVGRLYYGPGRYDYGRPEMPKGWFQNIFYPVWEFLHLMFVADRWIFFRQIRHFVGIAVCFFPLWLDMKWNTEQQLEFKRTHAQ